MQYKLVKDKPNQIMFINGEVHGIIPFDENNSDYQTYLKWLDGYEWQMIEPMKMEVGVISTPKSLKSKSTRVIPTSHTSPSPQNDDTSTFFVW